MFKDICIFRQYQLKNLFLTIKYDLLLKPSFLTLNKLIPSANFLFCLFAVESTFLTEK